VATVATTKVTTTATPPCCLQGLICAARAFSSSFYTLAKGIIILSLKA